MVLTWIGRAVRRALEPLLLLLCLVCLPGAEAMGDSAGAAGGAKGAATAPESAPAPRLAASRSNGVTIRAEAVEIVPDALSDAALGGAWVLEADDDAFGGLSGMLFDGRILAAISDRGTWFEIPMGADGAPRPESVARMTALRSDDGSRPGKSGADAEGLAADSAGRVFAAFERDHRIAPVRAGGVIGDALRLSQFEGLPSNGGLEALAVAEGVLLAIAETASPQGFPVFALEPEGGRAAEGYLPASSRHSVTGADVGPDGRLYVVLRDFSLLSGVSIRVRRYDMAGTPPMPVAASETTIAEFEQESGIDNMEAISAWRDGEGRLRLRLLSDDNFNALQRTLLVDIVLEP